MRPPDTDLEFGVDEQLWRRIEPGNVKDGRVKPNALRLQVSVVRAKHGSSSTVAYQKWNGIAEARAGAVAALSEGAVRVACVDEPTKEEPGHALIAMIAAPGDTATQATVNALRAKLAAAFEITLAPTPLS